MAKALEVGVSKTREVEVDRERTISFMGEECRVYATPAMIWDIEGLCRDLLVECLDEGKDSVGTYVSSTHTAATLIGMTATLTATITEIDGPRVNLEITGRDQIDDICKAKHTRFVVGVEKTAARLNAKLEKFKGLSKT